MKINLKNIFYNYEILFALFLFRYPIVRVLNNEFLYDIIIILAIFMLFLKKSIDKKFIALNSIVLFYLFINYFFYFDYRNEITHVLKVYMMVGLLSTFIFSYCKNYAKLLNYLVLMAIINIFIVAFLFINRLKYDINYMDLGYYLLNSLLIIYLKYYKDKKKMWFLIIIPLTIFIFIYGSRGATISFIFSILITIILDFKNSVTYKKVIAFIFSGVIIISGLFIITQEDYLLKFNNYLNSKGIFSYAITKYVDKSESFSSGRVNRYELALNDIKQHPFIGNGVGNYSAKYGLNYVHNIFLQLMDEGGILLLIIVVILILRFFLVLINTKNTDEKLIYILLISLSFKLIITSQYWDEFSFWLVLNIALDDIKNKVKR
ncbi:O-antigen ligase family protein [Clostridium perfringens]|uniref:O-antigen ligase family protein n=4 Tax=Clostridium perfringens TaxID=1502 RepID=UPI0013E32F5A|nr:O-antigen ligase family protein [Clostridium perfringens]MCX0384688.1 O-antigen ligase family protein [Clostridium perfringens]